jgi:hypothetical protein
MAVIFEQRTQLGPNDLRVEIHDSQGNGFDPFLITYAFYGEDHTRGEWRVGLGNRSPVRENAGKYYVGETLSAGFIPGSYFVQWVIQRTETSPLEIIKKQEFALIGY